MSTSGLLDSVASSSASGTAPVATLANQELLARLRSLIDKSREEDAELLVHLGEVDARKLYLEEAFPSMFEYCVRALNMEEGIAYSRIHVARASRRHPELLAALRCGEVHLTGLRLIVPQLTPDNCREWIRAVRHRSVAEIRALIADRQPKPEIPASISRLRQRPRSSVEASSVATNAQANSQSAGLLDLTRSRISGSSTDGEQMASVAAARESGPHQATAASALEPAKRTRSEPLGEGRYCVKFTADRELYEELTELRSLLRHQIPDGDLAKILKRAVRDLLRQVRKRKFAELAAPRAPKPSQEAPSRETGSTDVSRHIPHAIRRAVWLRDEGSCGFVSKDGRRCGSLEFLEFDHLKPWARTQKHSEEGISLRCRAHNQAAARRDFGERHMAQFVRQRPGRERDDSPAT